MVRLKTITFLLLLFGGAGLAAEKPANLRGRVIDFQTSEPLGKAVVSIRDQKKETITLPDGHFELKEVEPGDVELYVTTVGYGLLKKKIHLQAGDELNLEIELGQEGLKRSDQMTVTTRVFEPVESSAVTELTLNSSELRNLGSVLAEDPLRAVQSLPGVAANDDFTASFALRGSGFNNVGFYIDGMLMSSPFHSIQDVNETASLSIMNAELTELVSLLNGGFPAKYGDRTAGALNLITRNGSHDKYYTRINLGTTDFSITSEGPMGKSRKASWLVSARKSYLNYLINHIADNPTYAIGLYDLEGKISYNPSSAHQLDLMLVHGKTSLDRSQWQDQLGINEAEKGGYRSDILSGHWGWTPQSRMHWQTRFLFEKEKARNNNKDGELLYEQNNSQQALKQDLSWQIHPRHRLESGYGIRRLSEDLDRVRFDSLSNSFRPVERYAAKSWLPSFYLQDNWTIINNHLQFNLGIRAEHFGYSGETTVVPRAGFVWNLLRGIQLSGAFGQYRQYPAFTQLLGDIRGESLSAERSRQIIFSLEQLLTEKIRFKVEGYDYKDSDRIFSSLSEFHLVDGKIVPPVYGNILQNSASGHSRGIEFFLQRRSANRLTGWISYAYSRASWKDAVSGLVFPTDFQQSHTLNLFGSYRLTKTLNLSTKFRYGSNFPIVGFFREQAGLYYLDSERNQVRVSPYNRWDFRINKAFLFDRWKMTLFAELVNLTDRKNFRYNSIRRINPQTAEVIFNRDALLPIIPTIGMAVEF